MLVPVTVPVAVTLVAPVPEFSARIPVTPPVTAAALMVKLLDVALRLRASIPKLLVPVTVPVAVTLVAPLPLFKALIPLSTPVTATALMVKLVDVALLLRASIPMALVPVTVPVAVTLVAPLPLFKATIPVTPPVTAAALMVKPVPPFARA